MSPPSHCTNLGDARGTATIPAIITKQGAARAADPTLRQPYHAMFLPQYRGGVVAYYDIGAVVERTQDSAKDRELRKGHL